MRYIIFTQRLEKRLQEMTPDALLRFGLDICKRLYPDYEAFAKKHLWGDADLLLGAIEACERSLDGGSDLNAIQDLRSRIDTIIPDTDDFGDFDGSYALNASAAVAYVLQFAADKSPDAIRHVATLYYDNSDMKLHELGTITEQAIDRHPMMEEARRFLFGE